MTTDIGARGLPMPLVLSTISPQMLGHAVAPWIGEAGAASSGSWFTNNGVLFFPFEVTEPVVVTKLAWYNGSTASGNVDAGIYTMDGSKIVGLNEVAQSGTSALQEGNITDTLLTEGWYLFALKLSLATGTVFGPALFGWEDEWAGMGCFAAAGAGGNLAATYTLTKDIASVGTVANMPFVAMCFAPRTLLA